MSERRPFAKVDNDEQLVFGIANTAVTADGKPVEDLQGDVIPATELEKAAYAYVIESRKGGTLHEEIGTGTLVESFVATPSKLEALMKGLGIPLDENGKADIGAFKGVAHWIGHKILDDATWADVKSGKLAAFSIGGEAISEEVAA
jgi:hypothetical protein